MSKLDKMNFNSDDEYTGDENTDAVVALRAFAKSDLESSVILSAGMNPRLYGSLENLKDFLPDENGKLRKKVILKVRDFRSAADSGEVPGKERDLGFGIQSGIRT